MNLFPTTWSYELSQKSQVKKNEDTTKNISMQYTLSRA